MTNYTINEQMNAGMGESKLIAAYAGLGYTHTDARLNCPECTRRALLRGKNPGPVAMERAIKNIVLFDLRSEDTTIAACPCGYRKIRKPKVPNNPINAATQGMVKGVKSLSCGCGAPLPKGRKKFCHTCRPVSNKVPKEVVSQTSAVY